MTTRTLLPLASLQPYKPLEPTAALEGQLVSLVPYSASTLSAAISIVQNGLTVQLQLAGPWAERAAADFAKNVGRGSLRVFACEGEQAQVGVAAVARARNGEEVPEGRRLRVVFKRGIQGWWKDRVTGRKDDEFEYRADAVSVPKKRPLAITHALSPEGPDSLDVLPPSRQTISDGSSSREPTLSDRSNLSARTTVSARTDQLAVPHANPPQCASRGSNPSDRGAAIQAGTPAVSKLVTGEPTTKRARKREERMTWGLTAGAANNEYVALDALSTRKNGGGVNVIAMAVVSQPRARMTGGTKDWGCILGLYDPTNASSSFQAEVRYYGKLEEDIPVLNDGDIIVMQSLNWSKDKQYFTAYAAKGQYFVLPPTLLLDGSPLGAFPPPPSRVASVTDAELSYARDLARWAKKHALLENVLGGFTAKNSVAPAPQTGDVKARSAMLAKGGRGRQLLPIQDVCADTFCDLQGEIVKYYKPFGGRAGSFDACSLYITDYTTNDRLYAYADSSEVRTPGQVTLQVSIFGAQNDPLESVPADKLVGRLVHLRNVRPKMAMHEFLEATMVEDYQYSDRRDVTLLRESGVSPDWLTAFKARREAYWLSINSGGNGIAPAFNTRREASAVTQVTEDPLASVCETTGLALQTISSALAMNLEGTYRFRARIIDYSPDRLEDWVRAYCPSCGDLSPSETTCLEHKEVVHEWRFVLALADEVDDGRTASGNVPHIFVPVNGDAGRALFPDFPHVLFPLLRLGESSAVAALTGRLRGTLGALVQTKRRKQPMEYSHAGLPWDVVLDAHKFEDEEGKSELKWFFADGRVAFR